VIDSSQHRDCSIRAGHLLDLRAAIEFKRLAVTDMLGLKRQVQILLFSNSHSEEQTILHRVPVKAIIGLNHCKKINMKAQVCGQPAHIFMTAISG
jgi:hypothetical protein